MNQIRKRISGIFETYDRQGIHRTGTKTDTENAHWLAEEIQSAGLVPILSRFSLNRIDPVRASIEIEDRTCDGVPFFDCAYTDAAGIRGQLGSIGSAAPIAVGELPPNWRLPEAQYFMKIRRGNAHRAMIAVCGGPRFGMPPGIALLNAEHFDKPFGPPVVQISSTAGAWVLEAARAGAEARLIAQAKRTSVEVLNVGTKVRGYNEALPPVVVMTPRSGWFRCVSERGGGIACWLEMMRRINTVRPQRDVWFIATTGHELGHLGLKHFIHEHRDLVKKAHAWIHLGANFAAAFRATVKFQASDSEMETLGLEAMKDAGIEPDVRRPVGARAYGEAQNIFDGGGRYVSLLGDNGLFHHPDDRWPDAVELDKTMRLIDAFTNVLVLLAN
jgi:hypothetical protein